jgi:hypothetical protein
VLGGAEKWDLHPILSLQPTPLLRRRQSVIVTLLADTGERYFSLEEYFP